MTELRTKPRQKPLQRLLRFFSALHLITALFFIVAFGILIMVAARMLWFSVRLELEDALLPVIEAIGLITIAAVALQMAQTVMEEEVVRAAHISAPTRVRRFVSRFLVVVVVALSIESLLATFKALHLNMAQLPHAAAIAVAAASLLAGWGIFVRFNRSAEELEPEAMEEAKEEDRKLE